MDHYIEIAAKHGLCGLEALEFASKHYEKDQEREERRIVREKESEERRLVREKESEEREREREREEREKEREREREEKEKERQFELEKLRLSNSSAANRSGTNRKLPKLPPFEENEDIDIYLTRFERIAQSNDWDRDDWAVSLSALLTGKALEVYHRLSTEEADDYDTLKEALLRRFGLTAEGFRKRLRESPPEPDETPGQYITRLTTYLEKWMSLSEFPASLDGLRQLTLIEQFLLACPKELELFLKRNGHGTLEEISCAAEQFLTASGQTLHEMRAAEKGSSQKRSWRVLSQATPVPVSSSAAALQIMTRKTLKCSFCFFGHETAQCKKAEMLSVEERRRRLLAAGACFICLGPSHIARTCSDAKPCQNCGKRHHILLCTEEKPEPVVAAQSQVVEKGRVLFQTARAVAVGPAGNKNIRVLLDTGSNQSFISTGLSQELRCEQRGMQQRTISTFGGNRMSHKPMKSVTITLTNTHDPMKYVTLTVSEIDRICGPVNEAPVDLEGYAHLKDLVLADSPTEWRSEDIDILIGMDYYQDIVNGQVAAGDDGPVAWETLFGWVLGGRAAADGTVPDARVMFLRTGTPEEDMERLWTLESIGIETPPLPSKVDEKRADENAAVQHFEQTCSRNADGRYEVRWPTKAGFEDLPSNEGLARKRLERCEISLDRSGRRPEYEQAMQQYLEHGFAERAPKIPDGPVHYLSHHAVYKGDKIRVVFDASAGSPNSLNDMVLSGPNMIADITGVLMRFRLNMVAVSADIEKAFLQLSLHKEDRDLTRFFWRNTQGGEVTTFRMARVVFGVTASPYLLQAVIRRHLDQQAGEMKDTADRLKRDIYCDDLLTSTRTEQEARVFAHEAKRIFSDARMNLTKWSSNRCLDLAATSTPNQNNGILLISNEEQQAKVLGVRWLPRDDQLYFYGKDLYHLGMQLRATKRNILRISARVYDPLGLISAFTTRAKMLLKELWVIGASWDEELPPPVRRRWLVWLRGLEALESLRIPRPYASDNVNGFTIHTFCDASKDAYAAAVYLHTCGQTGPETRLVMSKSRLSPSKPMSLPRLELMGTVLGSRLTAYVIGSLDAEPQDVILWTDSSVALAWIKSDPRRWGTFVCNRVTEIQQRFSPSKWHHCPGESNPADLPSRGAPVDKLRESFWQEGPAWLRQDAEKWPAQRNHEPAECKREERKGGPVANLCTSTRLVPGIGRLLSAENFSSRKRLHRVTAWILRFADKTRKKGAYTEDDLTAEEIGRAEEMWIKETQEVYREEQSLLEAGIDIPRSSPIFGLNPYLDKGVLRVKGRLQESKLTLDEKHPILLPSDHRYVQLLILEQHLQLCHGGVQQTMFSLRDRFWVPRSRQRIRQVIRMCPGCRIHQAVPFTQEAAPLPRERVCSGRPFSRIGVDLGGPIYAKDGNDTIKAYFVIFTCAVVRAVHLELVKGLSTDDFLQAFDRFVARRSSPETVISDNARNFRGAAAHLAHCGVKWKFNAPRAPWWGGFYERLVRTTKNALRRTLHKSMLSFLELQTVLCRIEGVINARPLSALSEDIDDVRPLAPKDFLQGSSSEEPTIETEIEMSENPGQYLRRRWRHRRQVLDHLWKRWHREYLRELRLPPREERSTPALGDVVLIMEDPRLARAIWPMGKIVQLHTGRDGLTRAATVRKGDGSSTTRPIQKLFRLECA